MKTVSVPQFDEFNKYQFTGYINVQIKDVPDYNDVNAICAHLPGIPQGGISRTPLSDLMADGVKDIRSFYDRRQNTKMLKGYSVMLKS